MTTDATTADTQRRLARLRNRPTLYELAAVHPDGRRYLILYCQRRGRRGLLDAISTDRVRPRLVALTGQDAIRWADRARDGATMGDWRIIWTGRTQRECICADPLDWIGRLEDPETCAP